MSPVQAQAVRPRMARPKPRSPGAVTQTDTAPRRLACDRCHTLKEKCKFDDGVHQLSCSRCFRLGKPCLTSRTRHGGGRPRKPLNTSTQPQAGAEFVWHGDRLGAPETTSLSLSGPTPSATTASASVSASTPSTQSHPTPRVEDLVPLIATPDTPATQSLTFPLLRSLSDGPVLVNRTPQEIAVIGNFLQANRSTFMRPFVLGPSFLTRAQNILCYAMYATPDVMLPAHQAILARYKIRGARMMGRPVDSSLQGTDYAYCARAVALLRDRGRDVGSQTHDWLVTLMLSVTIVTFDLLDSGMHAHSIARFALGLLMQHLVRTGRPPGSAACTTALQRLEHGLMPTVFLDTWNSIVRREVPACRFVAQTPPVVDRYLGLCGSLLEHLYDISCLSRDYAAQVTDSENDVASTTLGLEARHTALRNTVLLWDPMLPDNAAAYTPQEKELLRAQVKIYRYAALLVLHRIRHTFGDRDDTAAGLSLSILSAISDLYRDRLSVLIGPAPNVPEAPKHPPGQRPRPGLWFEYRLVPAFLVASVELVDEQARNDALQKIIVVVCKQIYPHVGQLMKTFLENVWEKRDGGYRGHWFDLTREGPPLVLF